MKDIIEQHVERVLESETTSRVQRLLQSRIGLWILAAISFFESSLPVPIITDPFMMAAILANRSKTPLVVIVTVVSSIAGGLAAFAMAALFFDVIAAYMSDTVAAEFHRLLSFGGSDTFVATITGAITPIPYTITAWVIAVAGGSVWVFIVASIIGRTIRYAIVGYCTYAFGPTALRYIRKYVAIVSLVILILVAVYVWSKM